MNKYLIILTFLCLSLVSASAQRNSTLIGVVKDEQGQGLQGVVIYVKSTPSVATQTDYYGNFELKKIPDGKQTLIVSMLGMGEEQIVFTGQESAIITLHEQSSTLDDVIVTGIVTRNKNSFTGSAATFSGKEIKLVSAGNLFQSIQTLEPSMTIIENNLRGADPNAMPDLEIRGKTSIVGELDSEYSNIPNQPLFILDGMEVDIDAIINLNVDRVKSVTVLKDAASTAIYGSKAANGVIVVETVPPAPGQLRVSYTANLGVQFPDLTDYNLMNASEKLEFERLAGR